MKHIIILFLFFSSIIATAEESSNSPVDRINSFVAPLKADGIKGFDEAMKAADLELNPFYVSAAEKAGKDIPSNESFKNSLRESLQMHGKVLAVRSTEIDERLKGSIKRYTVELEFVDGAKKRIKFQFIQPTLDGKYKLMKSEFLNY